LIYAVNGVIAGELTPEQGNCIAKLCSTMLRTFEAMELESRLSEIEAKLGISPKRMIKSDIVQMVRGLSKQ